MKNFLKLWLFYFISLLFIEYVYKVACFNIWFNTGLLYTALFSLVYSFFMAMITSFLPKKLSFPVSISILILTSVIFCVLFEFFHIYNLTFSIYALTMVDQAFDFTDIIVRVLLETWYVVLLFFVPVVAYILLHKHISNHIEIKNLYKYAGVYAVMYALVLTILRFGGTSTMSPYNLYYKTHAPTILANKLGILTEFRLDIERCILGFNPDIIDEDYEEEILESIKEDDEEVTEYNELDLNFDTEDASIQSISDYLSSQNATNKNEYTGLFEGKNIIYILAEGFNSIAVDEDLTPTLYKLVNSSFVFENYYSPMFMSTTGGEFQFSTGLIPTQSSLKTWKEGKVTFPYAIGNAFKTLGYNTYAYHDWTYTYYKRNKTMPTLGYDTYKACGNGLEKSMNCNMWPTSDLSMMESTIDDYIDEEHFAVHYITVSGHAEYNFTGNNIAYKNKSSVQDLPYSTAMKAYLATQMELDKALEYLISRLESKGILDDTVIVLSGDHYPYTLDLSTINEKSSYERDATFEVNHSNLVIYNTEVETTVIDKLSCSVDVIPTILNLFGIDYDSRLLLGKDIMSDEESIVIFSDNSWITEKGRYNATTNKFYPNEEMDDEDAYVSRMNQKVQNRINISTQIISTDYYTKFFAAQETD